MTESVKDTQVRDAVLLVAGMGSRLRPLTNDKPKCLVEVAGTPLIIRLLKQLKGSGIERAWLVTGYKADVLEAFLEGVSGLPEVRFVDNDAYNTANNAESLRRAMLQMNTRRFLLCDGDILIGDPTWLNELVVDTRPNVLAVLLQLQSQLGEEEMKVQVEGVDVPWYSRRVIGLSKGLNPSAAHGESIGAQVVGELTFDALLDRLNNMSDDERENSYYEDIFATLFEHGHEFYTLAIQPGSWTEIDTIEDLEAAEELYRGWDEDSAA